MRQQVDDFEQRKARRGREEDSGGLVAKRIIVKLSEGLSIIASAGIDLLKSARSCNCDSSLLQKSNSDSYSAFPKV